VVGLSQAWLPSTGHSPPAVGGLPLHAAAAISSAASSPERLVSLTRPT